MIVFNKPYMTGKESFYISEAQKSGQLAGDGYFTKKCSHWIESKIGANKALITHSCTAALEMAAILADIKPDDEIIMPSYTFVSSANAFVLRGGVPVFVDIKKDDLNIDECLIEQAITSKTKAILVVHYAGVSCEMNKIMQIAKKHNLLVIEDAAQGVLSKYKNKYLGSIGDLGCYSFHETKNIISGEGGALLINNSKLMKRAEVIWQKGTNRQQFISGEIDKYSWMDIGSSFLPGELISSFLLAQLEKSEFITKKRLVLWNSYHKFFRQTKYADLADIPEKKNIKGHNGHIFFLIFRDKKTRDFFIKEMSALKVQCVFHYAPLHTSPFGIANTKSNGSLVNTENLADRIVRLPLWLNLDLRTVTNAASKVFEMIK